MSVSVAVGHTAVAKHDVGGHHDWLSPLGCVAASAIGEVLGAGELAWIRIEMAPVIAKLNQLQCHCRALLVGMASVVEEFGHGFSPRKIDVPVPWRQSTALCW